MLSAAMMLSPSPTLPGSFKKGEESSTSYSMHVIYNNYCDCTCDCDDGRDGHNHRANTVDDSATDVVVVVVEYYRSHHQQQQQQQ